MGIYDREYYRREGPSFLESISRWGRICKWLIGINVVCFFVQWATIPRTPVHLRSYEDDEIVSIRYGWFTNTFDLDTTKVLQGQVWRLLTHAFLHDPYSIWHIVFNMLFLWWFGTRLEDLYGSREFLAFYLMAAIAGGVAYAVTTFDGARAYGASGAVTGVLVLYAFHFPRDIINIWGILPVPIWLFVGVQVLGDTMIFATKMATGVAVAGHLGGAAFGFAYFKMHLRLMNLLPDFRGWWRTRARSRPPLRVYREEDEAPVPVPAAATARPEADEQLEAKLDAVLEKVARHGQSSLTENERQILFRASEVYKRRRT